jgi:glycosyltransferase involved in cell wall biosynthesis
LLRLETGVTEEAASAAGATRLRVTYAALGGLGDRYANTNFGQRVALAPDSAELTVLVPKGTNVSPGLPEQVRVRPAPIPTLVGFYLFVALALIGDAGRRAEVVVTDRSAVSLVGWALRGLCRFRWVADLWDTPHKELVADYLDRAGPRARLRRAASALKAALLGRLLARADLVLVSLHPGAIERYDLSPERVRFFSNAIRLEQVGPPAASAERLRRSVCYVTSRFISDRGVSTLVRAIELWDPAAGEPPRVSLMGEMPSELREAIVRSSAVERFTLIPRGTMAEAHGLILRSEIGVVPWSSNSDLDYAFPIKLYEYMALGCAVVASELPAIRAVVGRTDAAATLVPADDPAALAAALQDLLSHSERLARQREAALIRVQEFDASPKIRQIYEALRACARAGPQARSRVEAPRAARSQRTASRFSE